MTHTVEQALAVRDAVRQDEEGAAGRPERHRRRRLLAGARGDQGRPHRQGDLGAGQLQPQRPRLPVQHAPEDRPDRRARTRPARTTSTGTCGSGTSGAWRRRSTGTRSTSSASASTGRTTAASPPTCSTTSSPRCCIAIAGPDGAYPSRVNASRRAVRREGRPRHPRHVPDDRRLPAGVLRLPRQHADQRHAAARPRLRQARHAGPGRRADAASSTATSRRSSRRRTTARTRRSWPSSRAATWSATSST